MVCECVSKPGTYLVFGCVTACFKNVLTNAAKTACCRTPSPTTNVQVQPVYKTVLQAMFGVLCQHP